MNEINLNCLCTSVEKLPRRSDIWNGFRDFCSTHQPPFTVGTHQANSLLLGYSCDIEPLSVPATASAIVNESTIPSEESDDPILNTHVFPLKVSSSQPCPYKGKDVKVWTEQQRIKCLADIQQKKARTPEELNKLVCFGLCLLVD